MPSPSRITTVVTPANSFWLVDLDAAKDEFGIDPDDGTQDGIVGRMIAQISAAANSYCGRIFVRQSYRDQFRGACNLGWGRPLILGRSPVAVGGSPSVVVLTATEDDTEVATAEWEVDRESGVLTRLDSGGNVSSWSGSLVTVEYDAGFDLIPEDLQAAMLEWLSGRWNSRGRDPTLRSIQIPDVVSETYVVDPTAPAMPSSVKETLDRYRVWAI
jgi:hypothetical protein